MTIPPLQVFATPTAPIVMEIPPPAYEEIRAILRERKQFLLDSYKDKCVRRRISIRIRATHCATADEYCRRLRDDDGEVERLLRVLTIHVSQFFRNFSMYEKLRREVLPDLFHERTAEAGPLRILSVGCATGEEPYSLAIILRESFAGELARVGTVITGLDVDPHTLELARSALYAEDRLKELAPATRNRFFSIFNNKYQLADEIQQLVTFRQGDLAADPLPASDLILCRNVLIYLERYQQERALKVFARSLAPGGVLVLGKSETLVGEARSWFVPICPVERIYRLRATADAAAQD
jgi:chemotaxis protein methyltransferase CheR